MSDPAYLRFLGGAGTVTGSRFLVGVGESRVLVDCGLFQGLKALRLRNWAPFPVSPESIDAVVLTHAHIDHSGYLPALVRDGFAGPIYATAPTLELAEILLRDCGHIHEEDARYANRKGFSKHSPALPLYTEDDAVRAAKSFAPLDLGKRREIAPGIAATLGHAGHILGSAIVALDVGGRSIGFSGDLGRADPSLYEDPDVFSDGVDTLVVESTYGDRDHSIREDALEQLAQACRRTFERGGSVLIPSFAVDRTPALLYGLRELVAAGRIPSVPVYVDSPLALAGLEIYRRHPDSFGGEIGSLLAEGRDPFDPGSLRAAHTSDESRAINAHRYPCIIISASGMATGGRVLHHLKQRLPDPRNTLLLVGFQAAGTRGRRLLERARAIKIHGRYVGVRADVENIDGFSTHADREEILAWLRSFPRPPETTFIVHGEPDASLALRDAIEAELDWTAIVASLDERVSL